MADSGVRGSERPEGSEPDLEKARKLVCWDDCEHETGNNNKRPRQDLLEEVKEELVAVRQQCEGHIGVVESQVDSHPCAVVVDIGAVKTIIREEAVAVKDLPVSDRQLSGLTGHCEITDTTVIACGHQAVASSGSREVDRDAGEAIPALSPHGVDLEVCRSTKLIPDQVVKLEKQLMEHEDVFS
ncbi:hypothetical protein E2C01_057963 [Portunus trituberculatus]|uniref:Uncharacterized protein n=1 Tax=Portunus trituberculatus TaxID=210409 RepID=A0A5B7H1X4_PORTR|nr:hypothetical protein [Portunus trituberculatus]